MLRVVFDTNVYISAIISRGLASSVFTQALQGRFLLITSPPILDELGRKLTQQFRFPQSQLRAVFADIQRAAIVVTPTIRLIAVPRDPDDNRILECAVAGQADHLVTGDQDLLSLDQFQGIPIITGRGFAESLPGRATQDAS